MQLRECKCMQSVTLLWPVALKSLACPFGVFHLQRFLLDLLKIVAF